MERQVTITSFQPVRLEEMRACAPAFPAGWLVGEVQEAMIVSFRSVSLTSLP